MWWSFGNPLLLLLLLFQLSKRSTRRTHCDVMSLVSSGHTGVSLLLAQGLESAGGGIV